MKPSVLEIRRVKAQEEMLERLANLEKKVDMLLELLATAEKKTAKLKPVAPVKAEETKEGEG